MEQKKGFTLPAQALKAAQYFQAKGDVRDYLNGILVDKAGFIVAGNGHVLIRIESADATHLDESVIVDVIGSIPQKADLAEFVFASDDSGIVKFASNFGRSVHQNRRDCMCSFRLIDGKYPDYQKVFKKAKPKSVASIGINTNYVALIGKAAEVLGGNKYSGGEFIFRGQNDAIEVVLKCPNYNAHALIMPTRI